MVRPLSSGRSKHRMYPIAVWETVNDGHCSHQRSSVDIMRPKKKARRTLRRSNSVAPQRKGRKARKLRRSIVKAELPARSPFRKLAKLLTRYMHYA
jgi:hypothetical protein